MLVLMRREREEITITTPEGVIRILVMAVTTNYEGATLRQPRVTLGIDAPQSYAIHRDNAIDKKFSS